MVNLKLAEKEVLTERDVILEERRSRVENSPGAILDEQMSAALYQSTTPTSIPVIGWEHEMAKLSREDALDFYKQHYAPNNAILVVTGDVTLDEVKKLAEEAYGTIPANPAIKPRAAAAASPRIAPPRRVELQGCARRQADAVARTTSRRATSPPKPGEAEALDLLMKIVGVGRHQPALPEARRRAEDRLQRRRLLHRLRPRLRQDRRLRGAGRWPDAR